MHSNFFRKFLKALLFQTASSLQHITSDFVLCRMGKISSSDGQCLYKKDMCSKFENKCTKILSNISYEHDIEWYTLRSSPCSGLEDNHQHQNVHGISLCISSFLE